MRSRAFLEHKERGVMPIAKEDQRGTFVDTREMTEDIKNLNKEKE
jgi:hypothetical protein